MKIKAFYPETIQLEPVCSHCNDVKHDNIHSYGLSWADDNPWPDKCEDCGSRLTAPVYKLQNGETEFSGIEEQDDET